MDRAARSDRRTKKRYLDKFDRMYRTEEAEMIIEPATSRDKIVGIKKVERRTKDDLVYSDDEEPLFETNENVVVVPAKPILSRRIQFVKPKKDQDQSALIPKVQIYSDNKVIQLMKWKQMFKIGAGLENLGNTCFMNSALQCLLYTPTFTNFLLNGSESFNSPMIEMVRGLFKRMTSGKQKYLSPVEVTKNLKNIGQFRLGRQEDSHEFIINLIDKLEASIISRMKDQYDRVTLATNPINKIFGGRLRSQLKADSGFTSNSFDPFVDLSLNIANSNSIDKSLKQFIHPDRLDGDNKWRNPQSGKLENATKTINIDQCPYELVIHLQRFTHTGKKIQKHIAFPERLNVGAYTSEKKDVWYNLHGIIVHSGSTRNSGHYFCFVKGPAGGWYEMDDEDVRQAPVKSVLSQNAYLLFYTQEIDEITLPFTVDKGLTIKLQSPEVKEMPLKSPRPTTTPILTSPRITTPRNTEPPKEKATPPTPTSEEFFKQPLTPLDEQGGIILTRRGKKQRFDAQQRIQLSKSSLYSQPTEFFNHRDTRSHDNSLKRPIDYMEQDLDRGRTKKKKTKETMEEFQKEDRAFKDTARQSQGWKRK